jgi:DNA-binding MarR family transcriptional regulator
MCDEANRMSERLARLEVALEAMAASDRPCARDGGTSRHGGEIRVVKAKDAAPAASPPATAPQMIEALIGARKLRTKYFDQDLFFDPAWAILIDLYQAELVGKKLCVSAVCYGSGVAETTALRYIGVLEQRGLIQRVPDPKDKRRAFLKLTQSAQDKLVSYFGEVRRNWAA